MQGLIKTGILVCTVMLSHFLAASADPFLSSIELENRSPQQDSLRTVSLNNAFRYYQAELSKKPSDSIEMFKHIGLIAAELKRPEVALTYTQKYIDNSADISILSKDSYNQIGDSEEFEFLKSKYLAKGNILIYAYFFIAVLGFFFALIINIKKDSDWVSNILISGFVIVHSLFILEFAIFASNIRYTYPHTYLMSSSVALLYGPLLYLYFKRITQQYVIRPIDALHLIPVVVLLVVLFPFYSLSAKEKLDIMFDFSAKYATNDFLYIVFIPKLSSYIIYGVLIGRLYFKNEHRSLNRNRTLIKWERNIYYIHIMYVLAYALYGISISGMIVIKTAAVYHSQVLAMSLMVLYIAQMAYLNPMVFDYKSLMMKNGLGFSKYLKSGLTTSLSEELKSEVIRLFAEDKVYRDSTLNLETLSEKLNTTRHNTSQIINEHFDMNFFELLNKFRIEEAINLLKEDKNGNLNIIDIAYEVGYNNKVTFNKAFKKATSLTPTQYIDSIKMGA